MGWNRKKKLTKMKVKLKCTNKNLKTKQTKKKKQHKWRNTTKWKSNKNGYVIRIRNQYYIFQAFSFSHTSWRIILFFFLLMTLSCLHQPNSTNHAEYIHPIAKSHHPQWDILRLSCMLSDCRSVSSWHPPWARGHTEVNRIQRLGSTIMNTIEALCSSQS